jgi:cell division protein FtsW
MENANQKSDRVIFFTVMALIVFGLVMIASAGIVYSQSRFGDNYYFFKRQLLYGVLPGFLALYFFERFDYRKIKKIAIPLFLATLVFLILVFIPGIGTKIYGANRWIQLGPISFQPSEMAKLTIILYLAAWLESKGKKKIKDFFEGYVPFLGIIGLAGFLIIKQPDTGTLGILVLVALSVFFASGASVSHLITTFLFGTISLFILIKAEPYRMNRFMVFLNPELDPRGIGYQINQALLAIGSGGIWGLGLGHSRQKFNYLPEPVGDSIFAIIGEELGMAGAILLIALFLTLTIKGFMIAKKAPDEFGKLVAIGITSWIVFQALINIAAMTSLIPLTGVPMPFISYGGTSLVFLMAGIGILLNISKQKV